MIQSIKNIIHFLFYEYSYLNFQLCCLIFDDIFNDGPFHILNV